MDLCTDGMYICIVFCIACEYDQMNLVHLTLAQRLSDMWANWDVDFKVPNVL